MRLLSLYATAALLAGAGSERIDLSFHPVEGSIRIKTFEVETSGWIESLTWNGNDLISLIRSNEITMEASLRVTDEYLAVEGGRPLELLRGFDSMRTRWEWTDTTEVLHPLLYRTVCFTWDERSGTYLKDWEPARGSQRALAGVWEDMDYRSLLPDHDVEVGEAWTVPLTTVAPVLLPGGSIHRDKTLWESWDLFELEGALSPRSLNWYRNEDVTCRLEGIETLQDRTLARISIQWTWWGWTDLLAARDEDTWWDRFSTQSAMVDLEMDCRGELLWDVEAGVFDSFLLEAECEAELEIQGPWGDIEVQAAGSGRWTAESAEG